MFKKILVLLLVVSIMVSFLSACGGTSSADNSAQTATGVPSSSDKDAQKLLTDLTSKARLFVNQPGWVHVTENIVYDIDSKDRGTLVNGTVIPLVQTIDIWYHINSEKLVYEYVWLMSDQSEKIIDVGVFLNNNLFDLMNNTSTPQNPYPLSLDYQFANEMDSFISRSGHPVVTTANVNDKNATVFTLDETLSAPKTTTDFTQPFNAAGTAASFDTDTGLLLRIVRTVTFADGTKRTFYTDNIAIETGVQPPADVLNYVNGVW
jgi:hypothetical protein